MTGWLLLAAAITAEVLATTTLTLSDGLTRHALTAVTVALYGLSYACLAKALKAGMEIGVAYAAWSGIGTTALAVIGVMLFGETLTLRKISAIALIIGGVTLLHLTTTTTTTTTTAPPADNAAVVHRLSTPRRPLVSATPNPVDAAQANAATAQPAGAISSARTRP
ncbi:multidrug efflux SMR transporter [Actinoplanes sp. NPDC049118]|uniref:DMT family transporter n=1 Tax=Actinoplanes sp. NPDC049118 TaxID=3155769 RepID=UPI0033CD2959